VALCSENMRGCGRSARSAQIASIRSS
jgi:hypothetical protein